MTTEPQNHINTKTTTRPNPLGLLLRLAVEFPSSEQPMLLSFLQVATDGQTNVSEVQTMQEGTRGMTCMPRPESSRESPQVLRYGVPGLGHGLCVVGGWPLGVSPLAMPSSFVALSAACSKRGAGDRINNGRHWSLSVDHPLPVDENGGPEGEHSAKGGRASFWSDQQLLSSPDPLRNGHNRNRNRNRRDKPG